jgi:hypothetical protein
VLSEEVIKKFTSAWLTGTPIGSEKFQEKVELTLQSIRDRRYPGKTKNALVFNGLTLHPMSVRRVHTIMCSLG